MRIRASRDSVHSRDYKLGEHSALASPGSVALQPTRSSTQQLPLTWACVAACGLENPIS